MLVALLVLAIASPTLPEPPVGYYATAFGKDGAALKSALHKIIDNHKVLRYTTPGERVWHDLKNIDVWEALVYTDSACPDSNPNCGKIRLLYLGDTRHIDQASRGKRKGDTWEREHVWPKSRGFPKKKQVGFTDLHHLRPADGNINAKHWYYGYDEGGKPVMDRLADGTEVSTEAKLDKRNESFEPPDRAKGQVARMIFYMAVRYELGDNGANENMPDLFLKDKNQRVKERWIGDLCTLLMWNNMFGPTDFEKRRNDRVMELQGNRNPFIDKPDWANLIWGSRCK